MKENKLSRVQEDMKECVDKSFKDCEAQIQAILFIDPLDSKESYQKINTAFETLHEQIYQHINKSLLTPIPEKKFDELVERKPKVKLEFIKKFASNLVDRIDGECGLSHLQRIGTFVVLFEKGDLFDLLTQAGLEVEE